MKMYLKYLKYLIKHKWFVFIECCKTGIIWRGIMHDMSKFRPDEFVPYARYFYGTWPNKVIKQRIDEAFDIAWLKHQHRNPHHWQHWLLQEDDGDLKILLMPGEYMAEMLADWIGAGRAINGKNDPEECKNWYLKNYTKIKLHRITRNNIDFIFHIEKAQQLEFFAGKTGTSGNIGYVGKTRFYESDETLEKP